MQILNSLEGLTGKGVGAVVVTASPENAKQLAEMLAGAGVTCEEGQSSQGPAVRVFPERKECGLIILAEPLTAAHAEKWLSLARTSRIQIIDLGDNNL